MKILQNIKVLTTTHEGVAMKLRKGDVVLFKQQGHKGRPKSGLAIIEELRSREYLYCLTVQTTLKHNIQLLARDEILTKIGRL